ncbi:MAG TPA: aspartyl/asparaginyl beta-hydroxylase domain-containing protein [Micromonosporaceae bacterium]|nr:aspartyl/asparaginyl beta-hydroxylase domain-containing protein [Micromonosporaceae bacterium]
MTSTVSENSIAFPLPGLRFDPAAIKAAYREFLARVPDAPAGSSLSTGLGLTHRPGVDDPWRDAGIGQFDQSTGRKRYEEDEFSEFNQACRDLVFYDIYRSMPFRVGRMRLITLSPVDMYHMHTDSTRKAHVAIDTNEDCRLFFRTGLTYHVPEDGRVHVFDTRTHHSAYNAGQTDRVHLVMSIID